MPDSRRESSRVKGMLNITSNVLTAWWDGTKVIGAEAIASPILPDGYVGLGAPGAWT